MTDLMDIGQLLALVGVMISLWNSNRTAKKDSNKEAEEQFKYRAKADEALEKAKELEKNNKQEIQEQYEYRKRTDIALKKTDRLENEQSSIKKLFYEIKDTMDKINNSVTEMRTLRENVINFEVIKAECVGELMELHKNDSDKMKDLYEQFNIAKREVYTQNSQIKK